MKQNQINNYLSKNYLVGKIKKISKIKHTDNNSKNFLIVSSNGSFVLKIINEAKPEQLTQICKILNHCHKNNIPVLKPIKNKQKKFVDCDTKSYLTKYQKGIKFNGSKKQLKSLATNLAKLHVILNNIPIKYNFRTNQKYWKIINSKDLLKIKNSILKKSNDKLDDKILQDIDLIIIALKKSEKIKLSLPKSKFKKQLIHHDIHPDNIIFNDNKVVAILDFNSMRKGLQINDVAFASFRFATFKSSNINNVKRSLKIFIDTYKQYYELDKKDIEFLNYYILDQIMSRLSFILQKRYLANSNLWINDYDKFIKLLKIALKLF